MTNPNSVASWLSALTEETGSTVAANQELVWLITHVLGKPITPDSIQQLTTAQCTAIGELVSARCDEHTPLQYLLGTVPFLELTLTVRPPTLIPRQETEEWCQWLIKTITAHQGRDAHLRILDLCTGSGCIALALAHAFPKSVVVGSDVSIAALALAEENRMRNNLTNCHFEYSNLFSAFGGQTFDLIVSNPPYISEDEYASLDPSVARFEDRAALVAADDGLAFYAAIAQQAGAFLSASTSALPQLVLEFGATQQAAIQGLLEQANFNVQSTHRDSFGNPRWLCAQQSQS